MHAWLPEARRKLVLHPVHRLRATIHQPWAAFPRDYGSRRVMAENLQAGEEPHLTRKVVVNREESVMEA